MEKLLIKCPNCVWRGQEQILGSIDEDGHYFVILSHNRSIKIVGASFGVFCGKCGELIFFKKGGINDRNLLNIRVARFSGVSFSGATSSKGFQGTQTT